MAWYLTYFHTGRSQYGIVLLDDAPQVFSQTARRVAQELGRLAWIDISNLGESKCFEPEVVWKEPLERLERIEDSQNHEAGGVAQEIHQPDGTAEYEGYRISG
ncbi:MAG: hypothetical protein HYT38_02515 [Candidatus Sungbacteria bacterium]|uniref:Uncharacterized protein n=1 Tax=Candidatus Sungiibacteriota bacterium TaxID=2750080 RepID=A0A931YDF5_9BACT|nr:hypothetical protein [Candidatus Sungbacteria bacterium]MBI2465858.1 hypothetical protein [Candidatus Sungbacteria bacterium]